MVLQARMSREDNRFYNPNRDIAHFIGWAIEETLERLVNGRWEILDKWLKDNSIGESDIGKAAESFSLFILSATDVQKETMAQALTRCGWDEVPEAAQVAFMACLGTVMSGVAYRGMKDATIGGSGPCDTWKELAEHGREASKLMSCPRVLRRPVRWYNKAVKKAVSWLSEKLR